jgi:hypothetical protein
VSTSQHFAIGLIVEVRPGALPAGLDEAPTGLSTCAWPIDDVHEPGVDPGSRHGRTTYRVNGWYYYPEDLEVVTMMKERVY